MSKNSKDLERLRKVKDRLKERMEELTALYEVSRSITSSVSIDDILGFIVKKIAGILKADICMIHLANEGDVVIRTSHGIDRTHVELAKPIPLGKGVASRVTKTKKPANLGDISRCNNDILCRTVKRRSMKSLLTVPLIGRERVEGLLTVCSKKVNAYTRDDEIELSLFASHAAVAIENARLFDEIKTNYLNTMRLLASVIEAKDTFTENHSESVMHLALGIASVLKLSEKHKTIIKYASLLHDIGKIGIDVSILRKPAPLSDDEWVQMKEHPKAGAEIIRRAGFLNDLVPAILYHHVKYSGGGYPATKIKKEEIPIEARILACADAYESMTSDRPYRKHLSMEEAVKELKKCSGSQFDPKVVKALLTYLNWKE